MAASDSVFIGITAPRPRNQNALEDMLDVASRPSSEMPVAFREIFRDSGMESHGAHHVAQILATHTTQITALEEAHRGICQHLRWNDSPSHTSLRRLGAHQSDGMEKVEEASSTLQKKTLTITDLHKELVAQEQIIQQQGQRLHNLECVANDFTEKLISREEDFTKLRHQVEELIFGSSRAHQATENGQNIMTNFAPTEQAAMLHTHGRIFSNIDAHVQTDTATLEAAEEAGGAAGMVVASTIIEDRNVDEQQADGELFERVEHDIDMYRLQESLWDAFFLQSFHTDHKVVIDVIVTTLLYIANVLVQILLTYLVFTNMSSKAWIDNTDLDDLLNWRISVSHGMAHYHQESNTSLASRVCTGDPSRVLAQDESAMHTEIEEYLRYNKPFNGPKLLACALFIWLTLVGIELLRTIEFTFALFSLKRSTKRIEGTWHDDFDFSIDGIQCKTRVFMVLVLVFPRMLIALWLGGAGVLYLVNSSTMGDLILNCMALGFVLDMDELLYNYVPKRTAYKLKITRPISLERFQPFSLDHVWDLGRLLSFIVLLLIIPELLAVWWFYVKILYDQIEEASAILCGGSLNIVFANDKASGVLWYATTSETGVPLTPDYKSIGIMQAIELPNEPKLAEYLQGWPKPDTVYAQRTSLEHLESLNKMSELESAASRLCVDLDSDEPSRAALKAITGMDSCNETNANDMWGRCTEPLVRRSCPVACLCNAVSWWYDRAGCPRQCKQQYEENVDAYLIHHMAVHEGCSDGDAEGVPDMAPHGGNFIEFAKTVERDLKLDGKLNESGHLLGDWRTRLEKLTWGQCMFRGEPRFDLERLLLNRFTDNKCTVMMLLDSFFDIGLCNIGGQFRIARGNMAVYCPESCQVCPMIDYRLETPRTIMNSIYEIDEGRVMINRNVKAFLECGYEWIFCGETRNGTTHEAEHYLGSFAREKIYSFYAEPGRFYWFEVVSLARLGMKLKIYDSQLQFARQQILYDKSSPKGFASFWIGLGSENRVTLKAATFAQRGVHYIVVETDDILATTDFKISMLTNESSCGRAVPLYIRCGEVLNASLAEQPRSGSAGELDVTGYSVPERIFRFQVDAGVEYTFDSCGSSIETSLFLYDNYLRQPALLEFQESSSENCSDSNRGAFSRRFEGPGEYHVVVESRAVFGMADSGEILLAMRCK